jgi:hypothetical protein
MRTNVIKRTIILVCLQLVVVLASCASTAHSRKITIIYRSVTFVGHPFTVQISQPGLRPVRIEKGERREVTTSVGGCADVLEVIEKKRSSALQGLGRNPSGGASTCVSEEPSYEPSVDCGYRSLVVKVATDPRVSKILMLRGRGNPIISNVASVTSRFGIPQGYYYEVVPRTPLPESLIELTGEGKVVNTIRLPRVTWCG